MDLLVNCVPRGRKLLGDRVHRAVGPHAEGLQALALGQHVVEALHQRYRLVDAHLDAPQDHGHLVDLLDLLSVLGVALLALLHDAEKGFHRQVHLGRRRGGGRRGKKRKITFLILKWGHLNKYKKTLKKLYSAQR